MFVKGEESHEANDVGQNTFDLGAEIGPPVFMFQRQLEERNHNSTFSAIGGWTVGQAGSDSPVATIEGRPTAATPDLPPSRLFLSMGRVAAVVCMFPLFSLFSLFRRNTFGGK